MEQAADVLITGAGGYVGHSLLKLMPQERVITYELNSGNFDIIDCISNVKKYLKKLQHVKHVIHLADMKLQEINSDNTPQNIQRHELFFQTLKKLPCLQSVIFSSSCSVYGFSEKTCDEKAPVNPNTHYAISKLKTEELLKTSGLPFTILRFGTAFGVSPSTRYDLLINHVAKQIGQQQPIDIFEPASYRPFVHVSDFSRALIWALTYCDIKHIYNVASDNASKMNVTELFWKHVPRSKRLITLNTKKSDIRNYRVNSNKITKSGFNFHMNLDKGIHELIQFHQV